MAKFPDYRLKIYIPDFRCAFSEGENHITEEEIEVRRILVSNIEEYRGKIIPPEERCCFEACFNNQWNVMGYLNELYGSFEKAFNEKKISKKTFEGLESRIQNVKKIRKNGDRYVSPND